MQFSGFVVFCECVCTDFCFHSCLLPPWWTSVGGLTQRWGGFQNCWHLLANDLPETHSSLPLLSKLIFCCPLTSFLLLFLLQDFTQVVPSGDEKAELGPCLPKSKTVVWVFRLDKQELRLMFALGGLCPALGPAITPDSLRLLETAEALSWGYTGRVPEATGCVTVHYQFGGAW